MYMTAESTSRNRSAILRGNPLGRLLCIEFSLGAGVVCVVVAIKTADILQMGLAARRYGNHSMRKLRLFGSVDRRTTREGTYAPQGRARNRSEEHTSELQS